MKNDGMITSGVETGIEQNLSIAEITDEEDLVDIALDEEPDTVEITIEDDPEFSVNLVKILDIDVVDDISDDLQEKYEQDKESREKRDEQYNKGLRRAGLDEEASPDGADFEGSSDVVHPMIAENCIDFAAREIKELIPANGPVKSKIVGDASSEKTELAQRKVDFLNLICTEYSSYRSVFETMLSQLPLGGSQFIKFWHDEHLKRPMCEFVPIDRVFIPFSCNDFYTSDRVTVRVSLSSVEYWRRVNSGLYFDPELLDDDNDDVVASSNRDSNTTSKTEQTNNVIEGKEKEDPKPESDSIDLLEIYTYLMLDDDDLTDGEYAPYIVTIKEDTGEMIAMYRNWRDGDEKRLKLDHLVMFDFIPWRGAYAIGLGQIIGSLSVAATGSLRALLDAAHINNIPTALAQKGMKMAGQTMDIQVGGITYIEGPSGYDGNIRDLIMPLPFNPPSQTLFSLLEWLTNAAGRLVKMPDGGLESMGDRTPASTSLAMIEQNSMTQSSIHQRLHFAQAKCFKILCRLIADYFDKDGYPDDVIEDLKISREMFAKTDDLIPVSDPNIMTSTQRFAQIQMVTGLYEKFPQLINPQELVKRTLMLGQVADPELLMTIPNQISRSNAVAENTAVTLGSGVGAFPDQNQLAHMRVHASWLMNPAYGSNPLFQSNAMAMSKHFMEHLAFFYSQVYLTLGHEQGVESIIKSRNDTGEDDLVLVDLTKSADAYITQTLAEFEPVLKLITGIQQQQAKQQQQNDPAMAKVAAENAKIQAEVQIAQMQMQMAQQKVQMESQVTQQTLAAKKASDDADTQQKLMDSQSKDNMMRAELQMEQESNQAKIQIELLKAEIDKIKALASIKSTNDNFELTQWTAMQNQLREVDRVMADMTKHQNKLIHEVNMSGIDHEQAKIAQAHQTQLAMQQAQQQQPEQQVDTV